MPTPAQSAAAAADQSSGYSGLVLGKIIQHWQPPADPAPRTAHVQVRINAKGHVSSCASTTPSGSPALDASVCAAVKAAGKFATPPYNLPIDVFLHFWTGQPGQPETPPQSAPARRSVAPPQSATPAPLPGPASAPTARESQYVHQVMEEIRTRILLPITLTGEHTCTVRLLVDAKGNITRSTLDGNGTSEFEQAVLSAVQQTAQAPPPPGGKAQELVLTFILEMP